MGEMLSITISAFCTPSVKSPFMLALAKECGIELTAADLEKQEEPATRELDDDELDAVAGGAATGDESGFCYLARLS